MKKGEWMLGIMAFAGAALVVLAFIAWQKNDETDSKKFVDIVEEIKSSNSNLEKRFDVAITTQKAVNEVINDLASRIKDLENRKPEHLSQRNFVDLHLKEPLTVNVVYQDSKTPLLAKAGVTKHARNNQ